MNEEPAAYVAVLIDATDPLNVLQRRFVEQYFDRLHRDIPRLGRLALYAVREVTDETVDPIVSRCNPGDGRNMSFVTGNPREARRRWQSDFAEPLHRVLDDLVRSRPAPRSPILEMIQVVSVTGLPLTTDRPKQLVIVSDMLQNTSSYTQYGSGAPRFADMARSPLLDRYLAHLDSVSVKILYLRRSGAAAARVQGRDHIAFWEDYFAAAGASLVEVIRVPG